MCQITLHIINPIVVKTRRHADAGCAIFRLFPSDTLIYGIPRDSSKNFNIHTCEHMILGQLRMGARQAKNAPLPQSMILIMFSWGKLHHVVMKPQRLFWQTIHFSFCSFPWKYFSDENISGWCCTREIWKVIPGISRNVINMLCFLICQGPCLFVIKPSREARGPEGPARWER